MDYFAPFLRILLSVDHNAAARLLANFDLGELLLKLDGVGDETAGVCLYQHELEHVDLLVGDPGLVELFEVFGHVIDNLLHGNVNVVFDDAFVDGPDD